MSGLQLLPLVIPVVLPCLLSFPPDPPLSWVYALTHAASYTETVSLFARCPPLFHSF